MSFLAAYGGNCSRCYSGCLLFRASGAPHRGHAAARRLTFRPQSGQGRRVSPRASSPDLRKEYHAKGRQIRKSGFSSPPSRQLNIPSHVGSALKPRTKPTTKPTTAPIPATIPHPRQKSASMSNSLRFPVAAYAIIEPDPRYQRTARNGKLPRPFAILWAYSRSRPECPLDFCIVYIMSCPATSGSLPPPSARCQEVWPRLLQTACSAG